MNKLGIFIRLASWLFFITAIAYVAYRPSDDEVKIRCYKGLLNDELANIIDTTEFTITYKSDTIVGACHLDSVISATIAHNIKVYKEQELDYVKMSEMYYQMAYNYREDELKYRKYLYMADEYLLHADSCENNKMIWERKLDSMSCNREDDYIVVKYMLKHTKDGIVINSCMAFNSESKVS